MVNGHLDAVVILLKARMREIAHNKWGEADIKEHIPGLQEPA